MGFSLQDGILTGDYILICKVVSGQDPKSLFPPLFCVH